MLHLMQILQQTLLPNKCSKIIIKFTKLVTIAQLMLYIVQKRYLEKYIKVNRLPNHPRAPQTCAPNLERLHAKVGPIDGPTFHVSVCYICHNASPDWRRRA